MKFSAFVLLVGTGAIAAGAQTKPANSSSATHTAKPATAHSTSSVYKLPAGIPAVHGVIKPMFTLRYQDIKIGTGSAGNDKTPSENPPSGSPIKVYHVLYTGYLAATGEKFDSSDEHRAPVMKDGKPVMGPDGKPQLGEPEPLIFPQGVGRLIPGFDQGVVGMRVGGKRRIFIPWQLGYGTRDIPARAGHPGIQPKSDLIFDVELVDVTDMPQMPQRPMGMPPHPGARPGTPGAPATPGKPETPAQPSKPGVPATPPSGTAPSTPPASATQQPQSK